MKTEYRGIAPERLMSQVENTAPWSLTGPSDTESTGFRRALLAGRDRAHDPRDPTLRREYLELLLAAHFTTVATYVPTDVDSHIRHHAWQRITSRDDLRASAQLIDQAARWDVREVSARWVALPQGDGISGHSGEWLGVRAGALLRAMELHADDVAESLCGAIDAELTRHAEAFAWATSARGDAITAMKVAATVAHNVGDLSRVVEEWGLKTSQAAELTSRYARLGHEGETRFDGNFVVAGRLNKSVTALENHRFHALREARALRAHRDLLLPIGPFFDAWGATVARHRGLDERARASVLTGLLECHLEGPTQQGCLRAVAGMHEAMPGGIDSLSKEIPARLRKVAGAGAVRDALRVSREHFEARMLKRYKVAMAGG